MKAFIVHRWDGTPVSDWYPWLRKQLEKDGFNVVVPEMPNTAVPTIDSWVGHLQSVCRDVDQQTYFVGHSIGCQAILRYLTTLPEDVCIGDIILVAG